MPASFLRDQLYIEAISGNAIDAGGGRTPTWSTIATVWGAVEDKSGGMVIAAGQLATTITTVITVRYDARITKACRVHMKESGAILEITRVSDVNSRRKYMQLFCTESGIQGV